MMQVSSISAAELGAPLAPLPSMPAAPGPEAIGLEGPEASSFGATLENAVSSVNRSQLDARDALADLASGQSVDLHGTMIRLERAEITLRAMTSVRDRLIAAYEQVMNMAL